jgi:hypothetical protein
VHVLRLTLFKRYHVPLFISCFDQTGARGDLPN